MEKNFDTRMQYFYIQSEDNAKDYKCLNCGMVGKLNAFVNGCPYCYTIYNIDYEEKDLGSKYHYDRVLRNPDIIDYDILDYDSFLDYYIDDDYFVKVKAYVRIVYFINNKFKAKYIEDTYIMKKNTNDIIKLENWFNKIKCQKFVASIDVTKGVCEYCHSSSSIFKSGF